MFRCKIFHLFFYVFMLLLGGFSSPAVAADSVKKSMPIQVPVRIAEAQNRIISEQIALIGTTEPFAKSTIASEISGVVEYFPIKEGDFVKKQDILVRLRPTGLKLRLKAAVAARERVKANLENAEAELKRLVKLKESDSISTRRHEEADYVFRALKQELLKNIAEIEYLQYEIDQKEVVSPLSGFVTKEHTQVGEWIQAGGSVVTIQDLGQIRVTVDVPERYAVMLNPEDDVEILVKSISEKGYSGKIYAVLPQGDPNTRTFPVRIHLPNPKFKIKSGMEALVTFKLSETKNALVVPKDAVVTVQNQQVVYTVVEGKAIPVNVDVLGYDKGDASIKGKIKPGDPVIIRGNERLRPGVPIQILK
ncbi:MAG TPA: efflux RND transporter periplasmic adaptor subunit [Deltaproteobacteria bacterium]|nr:efflux RND transporter periplasmic adaptor subunit [Deltaproteobacteria bacterium]